MSAAATPAVVDQNAEWLPEYDNPDYVYEPRMPTLRNEGAGYWATTFPDFEPAVRWWALLYAAFGCAPDDAIEAGQRWAMRNGYPPPGYRKRPIASHRVSFAEIKARVAVEDVASRLTELRGTGDTRKGKCPFHDDRTPSFVVWIDSQRWRCFGACATGGDVIDLLQKAGLRG